MTLLQIIITIIGVYFVIHGADYKRTKECLFEINQKEYWIQLLWINIGIILIILVSKL